MGMVCTVWGGEPGGGIFALRRPRPYSRAIARRLQGLPPAIIIYAHADINRNGERGDNDAARHVATKTAPHTTSKNAMRHI